MPVWQLIRTSSSWRACNADRFEVAPRDKWEHISTTLRFVRDEAQLRMRIADDGRGASASEGNGVVGMRERVRALGGSFEFASSKAGTAVEVAVPLPVPATGADA